MDCLPGSLSLFISELRADPSLDTGALSHVSLQDVDFLYLFGWLTKGGTKLPDQILEDDARISVDEQTLRPEHRTPESDGHARAGFPRSLKSLKLTDVSMNDLGFEALVKWLQCLHENAVVEGVPEEARLSQLNLCFNRIQGTSQTANAFVSALSFPLGDGNYSSSLSSLILTNNPLSPEFKQTLFTILPMIPSLQLLHLSCTGLSTVDAGFLASYIGHADRRCKLVELHASANYMGYWGVRKVVNALRRCWIVERVEMFGNLIHLGGNVGGDAGGDLDEDGAKSDEEIKDSVPCYISQDAITTMTLGSGCGWPDVEKDLKNLLARNIYLKHSVTEQALKLLRYSRLLLWNNSNSIAGPLYPKNCECSPRPKPTTQDDPFSRNPGTFPFIRLPTEIKLTILSHLAPFLSTTQKIRIFEYASNKATLPSLRLCLPSSQSLPLRRRGDCVPDPAKLGFGLTPGGISNRGKKTGSLSRPSDSASAHSTGCSEVTDKGMKSRRETEKRRWLTKMGCDGYDPGASSTSCT